MMVGYKFARFTGKFHGSKSKSVAGWPKNANLEKQIALIRKSFRYFVSYSDEF